MCHPVARPHGLSQAGSPGNRLQRASQVRPLAVHQARRTSSSTRWFELAVTGERLHAEKGPLAAWPPFSINPGSSG